MNQNEREMSMAELELELLKCFPQSFYNHLGEFIAHKKSNTFLITKRCTTPQELKVAVIEWFSRAAYKTCPYRTDTANRKFHRFMLDGVNRFLGTNFTYDNMDLIYTYLGNGVNHNLAVQFVESGFCMEILVDHAARKGDTRCWS